MAPRRLIHLLLIIVGLTLGGLSEAREIIRSPRGFQRDLRRMANVPKVSSLTDLLDKGGRFTKGLLPKGGAPWRFYKEGERPFAVDLGNGCRVEGKAYRINLPMMNTTKLTDLKLVNGTRSRSLMPTGKTPILLEYDTAFYYDRGRVSWHGPESRFAILSLFHELGHVKDLSSMPENQQAEFRKIYDLKTEGKALTDGQKRKMVGYERSAWAHALKQARQLRREGFDILGNTPRKAIFNTINGCLKNYYDYSGK